jgi:hypothetical protein
VASFPRAKNCSKINEKKVDWGHDLWEIVTTHGNNHTRTTHKMKIKTLAIAAATLAVGAITSQAQVYSQNIVGYVNIPETAGGFSLEAPPLDSDGTGTNNTLATLFSSPGTNDNVYVFNTGTGQYDEYSYLIKTSGHGTSTTYHTNWWNPGGNVADSFSINPGKSYFYNAFHNKTNTYVGQVLEGVLTNANVPAANGFNLVSSVVPIGGGLTTALGYVPHTNDNVYLYNTGTAQYDEYSYLIKTSGHGTSTTYHTNWWDPAGNPNEPVVAPGQGFWLNPAATVTWTQTFTN